MIKKTFIRAIEFWVPDARGTLLEFGGGLFGTATRFGANSRNLCFGRGEGLPGQAWEAGHPVILHQLSAPMFRREASARANGLTCAMALPIFQGDRLTSVVVLFCGDDQDHAGAIELWQNNPVANVDMELLDGYYGSTGDTFEFLSRNTSFRAGTGLPGRAWARRAPVFMPDLGRGSGFLRADSAVQVGINRGFAIPGSCTDGNHYVLAFLSALTTPIASQVDVWEPAVDASKLVHSFGFSEATGAPSTPSEDAQNLVGELVQRVFSSGVPAVSANTLYFPVSAQDRATAVMGLAL